MAASPALLLQTDEADTLLTAMRGADSRASRMNEMRVLFERDNHEAWPSYAKAQKEETPGDVEELAKPDPDSDESIPEDAEKEMTRQNLPNPRIRPHKVRLRKQRLQRTRKAARQALSRQRNPLKAARARRLNRPLNRPG